MRRRYDMMDVRSLQAAAIQLPTIENRLRAYTEIIKETHEISTLRDLIHKKSRYEKQARRLRDRLGGVTI